MRVWQYIKDEAFGSQLTWHAGLMDKSNPLEYNPVIHLSGSGSTLSDGVTSNIKDDSCSGFLKGKGLSRYYYTSTDNPNSAALLRVRDMARTLRYKENSTTMLKDYTYHFFKQIEYEVKAGQTWVYPEDIKGFRCDGVVEYAYEYYGHRIYGDDNYWDISRMGTNYKNEHKTTVLNIFHPKLIAENYMRKAYIIGDVDNNGVVTSADASLALGFSAKLASATDLQKALTDVNFDGVITAADARLILRIAANLE